MPEAAQTFQVHVIDSPFLQRRRKSIGVEVRNAPRFGDAAYIHEALDAMSAEDREKFFDRARGMPDGKHG